VGHYLALGSSHQALRLASEALAEAPDDTELLAAAARAAWLLGLYDEALAHVQHWHDVVRGAPAADRAAAARMLGRVFHELGRTDEMWECVAELKALVDELPAGEDRALTMAWLAQLTMLHFRTVEAIEWADRAIVEADAVGAKAVRAQAMVERASALYDSHAPRQEAEAAFREAIAAAEAVEDWVLVARAINNMGKFLSISTLEGERYLTRLREVSERAGYDGMGRHSYRYRRAELAVMEGDLAQARNELQEAADATGRPGLRGWHFTMEAVITLEEGDLDTAADALVRAEPEVRPVDRPGYLALRLKLAALRHDTHEGLRLIAAVTDTSVDEHGIDAETAFDRLEAIARLGLGEHGPALVEHWAQRIPSISGHYVTAANGLLEALAGHTENAVELLAPVVDDRELILAAYQRSWLRVVLARSLQALGRREEALAAAGAARDDLAKWPGWRRDEIDALVRRLSGTTGPANGSGSGEGELTAREREVAALLAEGLSNAELARRLYISPKTAAVHVSNILMKLGMSSRAEVAAWAVRSGLVGGDNEVARGR
jgi:DNA-binding CsgD family transcriptional regulator